MILISSIVSLLMPFLSVFPQINHNILISVGLVCLFFSSSSRPSTTTQCTFYTTFIQNPIVAYVLLCFQAFCMLFKPIYLIHRMELFPTPLLQTGHENLKVFVDTVLSLVQKSFVLFIFTFKPFFIE